MTEKVQKELEIFFDVLRSTEERAKYFQEELSKIMRILNKEKGKSEHLKNELKRIEKDIKKLKKSGFFKRCKMLFTGIK